MAVAKKKSAEVEEPIKADTPIKTEESIKMVDSIKAEIIEAFMSEFKGVPGTELSVIVHCGRSKAPTYQEIELPVVKKILEDAVKQ